MYEELREVKLSIKHTRLLGDMFGFNRDLLIGGLMQSIEALGLQDKQEVAVKKMLKSTAYEVFENIYNVTGLMIDKDKQCKGCREIDGMVYCDKCER